MPSLWTRRVFVGALVAALAAPGPMAAQKGAPVEPRVVAIGDIHGAIDEFAALLRRTGLTDASGRWSGGSTILVQTGDYTDRGTGTRAVMDVLMRLEREARQAGGRADVMLGNHEVMNLIGDLRDVTPEIVATFADARSESRRERAFKDYERLAATRAEAKRPVSEVYLQPREAWMAAHPPGWLEYWEAFAPRGTYGSWLRRKSIFAKVGGALFMHAGLDPTATPTPRAEEADKQVRAELQRFDRFRQMLVQARLALPFFTFDEVLKVAVAEVQAASALLEAAKKEGKPPDLSGFDIEVLKEASALLEIANWAIVAPQGPMWYRGYAQDEETALDAPVSAMLAANGISRIVVGHTPQRDGRITARLGGRVVLIDTGMLTSYYKGVPAALEFRGARLTAVYPDDQVVLLNPGAPR
jgi:hypothetical protein